MTKKSLPCAEKQQVRFQRWPAADTAWMLRAPRYTNLVF
uniref:Uncharacterized protein n=1 Tax=Anguilla anguilla TaxID=7936 RepID=A0A0E9TPU1_ANGAN